MVPAGYIRLQPPSHTVAASVTYGCSLRHIRLQPPSHTVAAPSHTVAASVTYGCSFRHTRLQPPSRTVAGALRLAPQGAARTAAAHAARGCRRGQGRLQQACWLGLGLGLGLTLARALALALTLTLTLTLTLINLTRQLLEGMATSEAASAGTAAAWRRRMRDQVCPAIRSQMASQASQP